MQIVLLAVRRMKGKLAGGSTKVKNMSRTSESFDAVDRSWEVNEKEGSVLPMKEPARGRYGLAHLCD